LLRLPGAFPDSSYAPDALLRGGKVLESNGRFRDAAAAYRRVAGDYPASNEAKEALFRLGLVDLLRDAPGEAGTAWSELGATDAEPDLRALGLLWQGKMESRAGDPATARSHWQQAADLAPTRYGGLRARGLLDSGDDPLTRPARLDSARLELSGDELAELNAWTSARGASLDTLAAEQSADPALARADELLALDLNISAGWEFDDLAGRYAGDPARLAGLALALHRRGQDGPALKQAQSALDAAHIVSRQAPIALQKLLYPLPYPEVFLSQSEKQGVDPLLFASLVRQESMFDSAARSPAGAMGLTQVVAPTAREIAGALGRPGFRQDDLFRPSVSLEFGAFYFGQRLKRFGGALFPALAAYNAGDGSADRWISDYGLDDIDFFAERIPYNETNHYVKVVFENYGLYRALYAQR
jgi:soluble lytic murein transglycosylase